MSGHMDYWDAMKRPPASALKPIGGGRLKGMSDISPMWRYQTMTEQYGPCGTGWRFEVVRTWTEAGSDEQVCAFAEINLFVSVSGKWSEAIPGVGGSMLVEKETAKLHTSDEAFKMAVTDALGTAMKMLGMAADIYWGLWDGSKYRDAPTTGEAPSAPAATSSLACPVCNKPMWDNRATKKNPKQPDAKCKDKACNGVLWKIEEAPAKGSLTPAEVVTAALEAAKFYADELDAYVSENANVPTVADLAPNQLDFLRGEIESGKVAKWLNARIPS